MSKKSRKRNKKILAAIGIGLGAAALASRNKSIDKGIKSAEDDKGSDMLSKTVTPKKQIANDKLDESLGARDGAESTKSQSLKDRRDESRGE